MFYNNFMGKKQKNRSYEALRSPKTAKKELEWYLIRKNRKVNRDLKKYFEESWD